MNIQEIVLGERKRRDFGLIKRTGKEKGGKIKKVF